MRQMTMVSPLGNKVITRSKRRYAVVTDVRDMAGVPTGMAQCVLRTDDYQRAVRHVCKKRPLVHQGYNTFFIYDTVLRTRVARG
jgi:hypothetical protein